MGKKPVQIKNMDEDVWHKFLLYIKRKRGTIKGYVPIEAAKALEAYIAADPAPQHQSEASLPTDRSLPSRQRIDVQKRMESIRLYIAKQFEGATQPEWIRVSDTILTAFLSQALARDPRTRRRYSQRLIDLGIVKIDQEDINFLYIRRDWLYPKLKQQQEVRQ